MNESPYVIEFRTVTKRFGDVVAVADNDLAVKAGEFLSILGPYGCGKTTSLRMMAGFEQPTTGEVFIRGENVTGVPAYRRPVNMVFQHYALFPHLSVADNVSYGLRQRSPKPAKAEIDRAVDEALAMVRLDGFGKRRSYELSGGQQQRVALARALAPRPEVVLLDEPFTALDASLRTRLRAEVRELLRALGTTAILVTHDQEEALSTADLVAVMRDGLVVQVGTPLEVYDEPVDLEVARFVGDAVEIPAVSQGDRASCALGTVAVRAGGDGPTEGAAVVILRPEQLLLSCPVNAATLPGSGVVRETSYHGHDSLLRVELADGTSIPVRVPGGTPPPRPGEAVVVSVTGEARVYPVAGEVYAQ